MHLEHDFLGEMEVPDKCLLWCTDTSSYGKF